MTCWRRLAETTNEYLKKGSRVYVEGEVSASAWVDSEGSARATLEVTARDVKFLDRPAGSEQPPAEEENGEEDLPF